MSRITYRGCIVVLLVLWKGRWFIIKRRLEKRMSWIVLCLVYIRINSQTLRKDRNGGISTFSTLFHLQQEQPKIVSIIEELLPLNTKGGFAALMSDNEKRIKAKLQSIASTNTIPIILSIIHSAVEYKNKKCPL